MILVCLLSAVLDGSFTLGYNGSERRVSSIMVRFGGANYTRARSSWHLPGTRIAKTALAQQREYSVRRLSRQQHQRQSGGSKDDER